MALRRACSAATCARSAGIASVGTSAARAGSASREARSVLIVTGLGRRPWLARPTRYRRVAPVALGGAESKNLHMCDVHRGLLGIAATRRHLRHPLRAKHDVAP